MATAKKTASKKTAAKKTAKKAPAKKSAAEKSAGKEESGPCWPGFKPVPGKKTGTKGSCEPKDKQTSGEKKADSKAAAASKREK